MITHINTILLHFILIIASIILVIYSYNGLKNYNKKSLKDQIQISNNFFIGVGSGLVVFVLGWWANNISFPKLSLINLKDFFITFLAEIFSIVVRLFVIFALLMYIFYITFKNLK